MKNINIILLGIMTFALLSMTLISADTAVSTCGTLSSAGTRYYLTSNISTNGTCITITNHNIVLDGQGFSITYGNVTGSVEYNGVVSNYKNNLTIKNLQVTRGGNSTASSMQRNGIYLQSSNNSLIDNVLVKKNQQGVRFASGINNTLKNSIAFNNSGSLASGFYTFDSKGCIFYNLNASYNYYGVYIGYQQYHNISNINSSNNLNIGLYLSGLGNSTFRNINTTFNGAGGIEMNTIDNCNFENIISNDNSGYGLGFMSEKSNFTNLTIKSNKAEGIFLNNIYNGNIFNNVYLWNCSKNATRPCILLQGRYNICSGMQFNNFYINFTTAGIGVHINASTSGKSFNHTFINGVIENSQGTAVKVQRAANNAMNNTFINVTYDLSKETVTGINTQLIRKWYYSAYVNDSNGIPVSNANIVVINTTGSNPFNLTTGADGNTTTNGVILDYTNNAGTRVYASPYTIYALNSSYYPIPFTLNVTTQQNSRHNMETRVNCWIFIGELLNLPYYCGVIDIGTILETIF